MGKSTSVLIRVQARSGKFLGPNAKQTEISVLNGGNVIFGPVVTTGDSGNTDPDVGAPFPPTASRDVIAVAPTDGGPPAGAYWLTADDDPAKTAGVKATFMLDCPSLLEFRATTNGITTSTMMWVVPGMQLTCEPGLLLSVPGLLVSVSATVGAQIDVTAGVTMMCGCPITAPTWPQNGPEPYWPEPEFQVFATLQPQNGESVTQQMTFATTNTFTTSFPTPETGGSTISVYALQQAESNVGYAAVTV
jgi:hypothetical protein